MMTTAVEKPEYSHTQSAPLCLILYGFGAIAFLLALFSGDQIGIAIAGCVGLILATLARCFQHLAVEDYGDALAVRFGPIPLFRRTVRYSEILSVEAGQTTLLDGWGIHMSVRGGWVWNLWGWTCVVIHFKDGGTLRIGTDDVDHLIAFLNRKIQ
jgi:hypothetical protein